MRLPTVLAGRYRLEQPLGSGGFGNVYRATQLPLGREVAVKLVGSISPEVHARFEKEAALAQRLEHPNTVRLLDFGYTEDHSPFLVWELLRGESLADLLARSGPLSLGHALRAGSQILKSLMEAHALGVVHRDIKPGNLFVSSHAGEPFFIKVLDFGIAKDMRGPAERASVVSPVGPTAPGLAGPSLTRAGQALGTPRYMAPEQARGEPVGPAADLYALGLVLAEMIGGRPVFDGDSAMSVMLAQASHEPVPLSAEVLASPLAPVLARATEKRPEDRYGSATEMLRDVEALARESSLRPASGPWPTGPLQHAITSHGLSGESVAAFASAPTVVASPTPQLLPARARAARSGLAIVIGLLLFVGLGGGLFFLRRANVVRTSSATTSATSAESDESDEDEPKGRFAVDFRRRTPKTVDLGEMERLLRKAGYDVKRGKVGEMVAGQSDLVVRRPPCGGTVLLMTYGTPSLTDQAFTTMSQQKGHTFRVDNRILYVYLTALDSSRTDAECTNRVAFFLTRPP